MGFGRGTLWPPNPEVHARVPPNVLVIGPGSCKVPRRQRSDFEQIAQPVAYALVPSVVRFMMKLSLLMMSRLLAACGTETTTAGQHSFIYTTPAGKEVPTTLRCGNTTDPCNEKYKKVRTTNNPSDEEFWQLEGRIAVRANIGAGPHPDRQGRGAGAALPLGLDRAARLRAATGDATLN